MGCDHFFPPPLLLIGVVRKSPNQTQFGCLIIRDPKRTGIKLSVAATGASIAGYVLAHEVLQVPYAFDLAIWVIGLLGGATLVAVSGWLATRSVLRQPPASSLRGAAP